MGYLIGLILLVILVPLIFAATSRRLAGRRRGSSNNHGVTVAQPAADEPTPGAGGNQVRPGAERRIPPA